MGCLDFAQAICLIAASVSLRTSLLHAEYLKVSSEELVLTAEISSAMGAFASAIFHKEKYEIPSKTLGKSPLI